MHFRFSKLSDTCLLEQRYAVLTLSFHVIVLSKAKTYLSKLRNFILSKEEETLISTLFAFHILSELAISLLQ